jgi:GNAT superfamily N-acetyltransferase
MVEYKRCTQVQMSKVFEAFQIGYSDYIIKIQIDEEGFVKRFFGPEGNNLEHSFIAFDGENAVGVILGGIKEYEGIKTQRCGTFAIHPDYRGKGISKKLFEMHREEGIRNGCRQLFLEVIVGNDRAVNFYKRAGYNKIYDISYFTLEDTSCLKKDMPEGVSIQKISQDIFIESMKSFRCDHINWQNDADFIERLANMDYYGAYYNGKLKGSICMSPSGKVFYIFVDNSIRLRGVGQALLNTASREKELTKLSISIPNSSSLEGFLRHLGFEKDSISQYEMYMTL